MKKVLVIGYKGFLGSAFIRLLPADMSLSLAGSGIGGSLNYNYDVVFHCGKVSDPISQSELDLEVFRAWTRNRWGKLVTFGSDACYSELQNSEEFYDTAVPLEKYRRYAFQKRSALDLLRAVSDKGWYHFVLTSMYGPNFDLLDSHLVHDLAKKIYTAQAMKDQMLTVDSSLSSVREVLFVDDVVQNVLSCISFDFGEGEPLNCGSMKKKMTISSIVSDLCEIFGADLSVVSRSTDHSVKTMDSRRIKSFLGDIYKDTSFKDSAVTVANRIRSA